MPFSNHKILIANRGEIAVRIIRACHVLNIPTVMVFSEADRNSLPVLLADEAICIGRAPASDSYLKMDRIIAAAELAGATAIHPGYGFLSENSHFAEICRACGVIFIGPSPETIRLMGDKNTARTTMKAAGIPVTPGSDCILETADEAKQWANEVGYPVILKAAGGGGGRGMRIASDESSLFTAFTTASREAQATCGDSSLYLEKYQINPQHIEIQILADSFGNILHLGDRDCSMQRRHQKVIEESPCPSISQQLREKMQEAAVQAAKAVGYVGVGTVEFLVSGNQFYFMEMNTRLQVEHPVTEMTTGIDLVAEQIKIALGEELRLPQSSIYPSGCAIELRINAESPENNFIPCPGTIEFYLPPGGPGIRVDSHLYQGYVIPPFYDNLLAKIIAYGPTRELALLRANQALRELTIKGVKTNGNFLLSLLNSEPFKTGKYHTGTFDELTNL